MHVIKMHVIRTPFPERLAYPAGTKTGTSSVTRGPGSPEHNVV